MRTVARWTLRTLLIAAAAGAIAVALRITMGPARLSRVYHQDEILRFHPTLQHGLVQLAGETFIIACCAWVARRWLRVKL
jgi:hypothetical protein